MEPQSTPQIKAILRKKSKSRGIIPPDFKLYYKAIESKQYGSRIKNRDRMEQNQEYGQLILDEAAKKFHGEKAISSINGAGKTE